MKSVRDAEKDHCPPLRRGVCHALPWILAGVYSGALRLSKPGQCSDVMEVTFLEWGGSVQMRLKASSGYSLTCLAPRASASSVSVLCSQLAAGRSLAYMLLPCFLDTARASLPNKDIARSLVAMDHVHDAFGVVATARRVDLEAQVLGQRPHRVVRSFAFSICASPSVKGPPWLSLSLSPFYVGGASSLCLGLCAMMWPMSYSDPRPNTSRKHCARLRPSASSPLPALGFSPWRMKYTVGLAAAATVAAAASSRGRRLKRILRGGRTPTDGL